MITLERSRQAWGEPAFNEVFKAEVEQLRHEQLPLQQGLSLSSYVSSEPFKVMVINSSEESGRIRVKAGIFYSGIIAGCSCSDDPTPTDVQAEYCDAEFVIDRRSGETTASLLPE
jgi:hypothetical protein